MKTKILYVDNRSQYFAANRLPLAVSVRDHLAEVHVATLSRREQDIRIITSEGLCFHKLRRNAIGRSITKPTLMALELASLFKALDPDLIHFFTLKAMCVGAISLLLSQKRNILMTVTGLGYTFTSNNVQALLLRISLKAILSYLVMKSSNYFIFQNQDDLSLFHNSFHFPLEKLHLIKGSGVDTRKYTILSEKNVDPTVILAARMLKDKGVFEFVDAAKQLKREGVRARFLLVGDTDPENPTGIPISQLMDWNHSGIVEWYGFCEDMLSLFSDAHIVCLPSYGEGLPKVLIEGAACGRPLVASNTPGCRDVVRHEENGLLVPPGDAQALADALRILIRDAELRKAMGRNGRALVERDFSLEKVINDTFIVYRKLLNID
jgi:glycosyltransferase involved in cell wall biosynthesis